MKEFFFYQFIFYRANRISCNIYFIFFLNLKFFIDIFGTAKQIKGPIICMCSLSFETKNDQIEQFYIRILFLKWKKLKNWKVTIIKKLFQKRRCFRNPQSR